MAPSLGGPVASDMMLSGLSCSPDWARASHVDQASLTEIACLGQILGLRVWCSGGCWPGVHQTPPHPRQKCCCAMSGPLARDKPAWGSTSVSVMVRRAAFAQRQSTGLVRAQPVLRPGAVCTGPWCPCTLRGSGVQALHGQTFCGLQIQGCCWCVPALAGLEGEPRPSACPWGSLTTLGKSGHV